MIQFLGDGEELMQFLIGEAASEGGLELIDQLEVLVAQLFCLCCQADLFLPFIGKAILPGYQALALHAAKDIGHGRTPDKQMLLQFALQDGFFFMVGKIPKNVTAYCSGSRVMTQAKLLSKIPSNTMREGFNGESNVRCCFHELQTIC